jgi:alpha-beta hydrolase superfamily lysophospholipase
MRDGSPSTATYVLIHGAGDVGWYWHLVEAELRARRHRVVVMDLPVEDDSAGLSAYAEIVVNAIGKRKNLVVVAQSFGGYIAPNRMRAGTGEAPSSRRRVSSSRFSNTNPTRTSLLSLCIRSSASAGRTG